MREIKFRAWDKSANLMLYPSRINFGDDGSALTVLIETRRKDSAWSISVHGESGVLMQYTGLKDKNGKEIYEGDIYKITYFVNEINPEEKWGKIIYNHDGFKLKFPCQSNPIKLGSYSNKNNGEVIGNIYENPDLLKE
jgi:uncharacterized phage protein (TIGR01671 family)